MKQRQRVAWVALILLINIGLDQATKWIAQSTLAHTPTKSYLWDTFRLTYAENSGAFLSLGSNLPEGARFWILTIGVGCMLLGLIAYSLFGKNLEMWHTIGYAIIAGGGLSNLIDRAFRNGFVVDFMNMGIGGLRTGIFNVADVAILIGIGLLLVKPTKPTPEATTTS